jgi:hypothetical protein
VHLKDLSAAEVALLSHLLDEALDKPATQREEWVAHAAIEHGSIVVMLKALLQAHSDANTCQLLDHAPIAMAAAIGASMSSLGAEAQLAAGMDVGPYRLLREIGHGGMAVVWLADRADGAFTRRVALKLLQGIRHRRDLTERFVRERDILARLKHPNIALLYDAGVAMDGQAVHGATLRRLRAGR